MLGERVDVGREEGEDRRVGRHDWRVRIAIEGLISRVVGEK